MKIIKRFLRWLYRDWFLQVFFRRYWYRNIYLRSDHWRCFRNEVMYHYDWTCQVKGCSREGSSLELHHLTYKNIGQEKIEDVMPLCWKHHDQIESGVSLMLKSGNLLPGYRKHK